MNESSRAWCRARDRAQAGELGYELLGVAEDAAGQLFESFGRDGLTSTMEHSDRDGWVLCTRDERGKTIGAPMPVGVPADEAADVLWALVEQDKPRYYRWSPVPDESDPSEFVATGHGTRTEATLCRVDEYWFLTVSWFDGATECIALADSWTAAEALVRADLAMHRSQEVRAGAALGHCPRVR